MKILIFTLIVLLSYGKEMLITKEYTEYLKKHVDWEVIEYEDNPLKGWTLEDAQHLFGKRNVNRRREDIPKAQVIASVPAEINWAGVECDQGIRNQGPCNAGWAFAVAGMMSDRCCLHAKNTGWLSPQELISCDKKSKGCSGGEVDYALDYVVKSKGLVTEYCFSYESKDKPCPRNCDDGGNWVQAHKCSCPGGIKQCGGLASIKSCLTTGPITITFSACKSINYYKIGIYKCDCEPDYIGTLTGLAMGYSNNPSCNINVKLSLGTAWGNKGYINIDCESCEINDEDNINVMCEKVVKNGF